MFEKELEKNVMLLTLVSGGQPCDGRPPKPMRQSKIKSSKVTFYL